MLSYEPLRNLIELRGIKYTDIIEDGEFSSSTIAKINKDEPIRFDILDRFCAFLGVSVEEIIQYRDEQGIPRTFNKSKEEYDQVVQELLDLRKKYEQLQKDYVLLETSLDSREKRKYEKSETIRYRVENLKEIRKAHDMTQKDIADALGLHHVHYARFERGTQLLNEKQLNEIKAILSVPDDEIEEVRE